MIYFSGKNNFFEVKAVNILLNRKEKKVEYIELIYDLIFVYIIGRNNSLLHNISGGFVDGLTFINYIICTFAVIQMWTMTTYYINVHGRQSIRDHIMLFINMFLMYFIGDATRNDWQKYHTEYHVAWALILINIALQYVVEYRHHKEETEHKKRITRMSAMIFFEALIIIGSVFEFNKMGTSYLSVAAILITILITAVSGKDNGKDIVDFSHLSERVMLYVVFTFGEMIIAISEYFKGGFSFNSLYFCAMAFLIVVGLFLSYGVLYDHLLDREKRTNGIGYIIIHMFLIFALNNVTAALEFMRIADVNLVAKILFISISIVLYYICLMATRRYAKQNCKPSVRFILSAVIICLVFIGGMFVSRSQMIINIAISVLFVFAMFFVLYYFSKVQNKEINNYNKGE